MEMNNVETESLFQSPDYVPYDYLFSAIDSQAELWEISRIMKDRRHGIKEEEHVYYLIIMCLLDQERTSAALAILEGMHIRGIYPRESVYEYLSGRIENNDDGQMMATLLKQARLSIDAQTSHN